MHTVIGTKDLKDSRTRRLVPSGSQQTVSLPLKVKLGMCCMLLEMQFSDLEFQVLIGL